MDEEISLYEAKAKLSALVRRVREGHTVVITVHGEPAAELRPVDPTRGKGPLAARLLELEKRGLLSEARRLPSDPAAFEVGDAVPGALARFLAERE